MWRLVALLLVLVIAACVLAWLITGQARYRTWATRLGKLGLAATLFFFALLILDRLGA
jgi:membrane protein YdbS with pleckstrin-like domain